MAKNTTRDSIWQLVIGATLKNGDSIKPDFVVDQLGVSKHTAQDTLNTMAEGDGTIIKREILDDDTIRYVANPEYEKKLLKRLMSEHVVMSPSDIN